MIQSEFEIDGGDEVTDSLVRLPRTSRHFLTTGICQPNFTNGGLFYSDTHTETTLICENCGEISQIFLECGDRTCFPCQQRRKRRILKRYAPLIEQMEHPILITLTLTRRALTAYQVSYIRGCFTKLRHRNVWKAKGGIYQIEIGTILDDNTANIHIHAIADSPRMPKTRLKSAWKAITGDSYIVDIERCWSPRGALHYLTKHMGKRIGKPGDAGLINDVLKGTRLVQGFGNLSHMGLSLTSSVCDKCGAVNSFYMDFEILTYRYPRVISAF